MDHPRNQRLHFDAESHTYTLEGKQPLISVTTVIESYFPSFDADDAIRKLKRKGSHPLAAHSPEDIKRIWDEKAKASQDAGTQLHAAIEQHLKGEPVYQAPEVLGYVEELRSKTLGTFVASEWAIYDEEWGIAGTLDALFETRGQYRLVDWKRSVIKRENRWESGHHPIGHLQASNYEKYSLQMALYGLILERKYGLPTASLPPLIVQLHPSTAFEAIEAADRRKEVAAMVQHFCSKAR